MKARSTLVNEHLRDYSLYQDNHALAYELGLSDGSRHCKGTLLTPGERHRRAGFAGWQDGFDRAIKLERNKDD